MKIKKGLYSPFFFVHVGKIAHSFQCNSTQFLFITTIFLKLTQNRLNFLGAYLNFKMVRYFVCANVFDILAQNAALCAPDLALDPDRESVWAEKTRARPGGVDGESLPFLCPGPSREP